MSTKNAKTTESGVLAINIDATTHYTIKESGNTLVVAEPLVEDGQDPSKIFVVNQDIQGTISIKTESGKYVGMTHNQIILSDDEQILNYSTLAEDPEHMTIYIVYQSVEYFLQIDGTNPGDAVVVNDGSGGDPKKRKWKFRRSLGGVEL